MKQKNCAAAIPALIFTGLLAAVSILNIAAPQKNFSDMENRTLAKFPALSVAAVHSGEWMTDFEKYATDQFLFRNEFMRIKTAADLALMRQDNGRVYFGRDGYLFSTDTISEKQKASSLTVVSGFLKRIRQEQPELHTSVLLAPTAKSVLSELLPSHAPVSDERKAIKQAETILKQADPKLCFTDPFGALYEAAHNEHGYIAQALQGGLYDDLTGNSQGGPQDGPQSRSQNGPQAGAQDGPQGRSQNGLQARSQNGSQDGPQAGSQNGPQAGPQNRLQDRSNQIYYRTDHHWTTDGAYAAYRSWAIDNGFEPLSPDSFLRKTVSDSFLGTNQAKAPGFPVKPDSIVVYEPDPAWRAQQGSAATDLDITVWKDITKPSATESRTSLYDESSLEGKDQYAYFLGGNDPQLLIRTAVKNGKRLLLIKDSYANCAVPFLARHYEEIYVTDLRYSHGRLVLPPSSGGSGYFTDVMFLYNIESFCSDRNLAYLTQLKLTPQSGQ